MPITKADQKVKKPLEQALIKIGMDGRIVRQNAGVESLTPSVPLHPSRQQVLKGSKHARRVHPRMREHRQKKKPSIPSRNSQLSLSPLGASLELRTRRKCAAPQHGLPHPHPVSRMPLGSERTLRASVSVTSRSRNAAVAICNCSKGPPFVDSTARSERKILQPPSRGPRPEETKQLSTRHAQIGSIPALPVSSRNDKRSAARLLVYLQSLPSLIFPIDIPLRAGLSVWDLLLRNQRLHSCCWGSRLQLR